MDPWDKELTAEIITTYRYAVAKIKHEKFRLPARPEFF